MRLALALLVTGTSLIGALLGLSGCGGTTSSSTQGLPVSQDQHYSQIVSMDASWSVGYKDLKTLKAASTSIVAGTIAAVAGATLDTTTNIPYTDFTVALDTVVHDPKGRVHGMSVTVHQTGGIVNGVLYQIGDDPLFQIGEHVILFLHEYEPGKFFVVGGPTGRFKVNSDVVSAVTPLGVSVPAATSEAAFIAQIRAA